jgi:FkbM family methyltransferase
MLRIAISELTSSDLCQVAASGEWRSVHHPAVGQDVLAAGAGGMSLQLRCPPQTIGVWLLKHGWSGTVEIVCNGSTARVSLTQDNEDISFVAPLPAPLADDNLVELRSIASQSDGIDRNEVWLLGLALSNPPKLPTQSTTLSGTTRLIQAEWGKFLVLNADTVIPTAILNEGCWAPKDVALFERSVSAGDVVIDVGANFGHHTIVFSKIVGPTGLVVAVEPQLPMFQLLCANCIINNARNVRPYHLAAGDHAHTVTMYPIDYAGENNFGALGINPDPARYSGGVLGEAVLARCLDDLVEEQLSQRPVNFIKIDVQSYEKFVLMGLLRTITKYRPSIFLEISPYWMLRAGYEYKEVYHLLSTLGYEFEHSRTFDTWTNGVPEVDAHPDVEWDILARPAG